MRVKGLSWFVGGLALLAPAFMIASSRAVLFVAAIASCAILVGVGKAARDVIPKAASVPIVAAVHFLQCWSIAVLAATGLETRSFSTTLTFDLLEYPLLIPTAHTLVPLGALCGAFALRTPFARSPSIVEDESFTRAALALLAVVEVSALLAAFVDLGAISYWLRVASSAFSLGPFVVGYRWGRIGTKLQVTWLLILLVHLVWGVAIGARAVAFIGFTYFAVGYFMQAKGRRRRMILVLAVIAIVPLIVLSAVLGRARTQYGRNVARVDYGRAVEVASEISSTFQTMDAQQLMATEGVGRLIAWSNIAPVVLTPDTVPVLGVARVKDEAVVTVDVAIVSGRSREQLYDLGLGNAGARRYGFNVDEVTAVEFGVLADGWSHGLALLTLCYGAAFGLALMGAELIALRMVTISSGGILGTIPGVIAIQATTFPLLYLFRELVLYTMFALAVLYLLRLATDRRRLARAS